MAWASANPPEVAQALLRARRDRAPCDAQGLSDHLRDAADAYAVQDLVSQALHGTEPRVAAHWKSGGPSREAAQTHAPLPPEGVWRSPADARHWPCNIRLIEVEIALRLGREVTASQAAGLPQAASASLVDAMAVSIELVDSRWLQGLQAPALLKLADLSSHGGLVIGEWIPFAARNWTVQAGTVQIGEAARVAFRGSHSMQDPAWVVPQWVRHATRQGNSLPRGTVVTTGTWCGILPAAAGDRVIARFEGIGEAMLQL